MRILVSGSRDWNDYYTIRQHLKRLPEGSTVVHGGARGADTMAGTIARVLGFTEEVFRADWQTHGRKAGILRNIEMLETKPERVIAFSLNHSKGCEHTISEARKRNIPTTVVRYEIEAGRFQTWLEEY